MTSILSEKEYQHFIMDRLVQDNGYIVRKATSYDRFFAMDRELLFRFLNDTQPDEMDALRKIYKTDLEDTIVGFINAEVTKARGSLLDVLKHGIEISNMKLELMYTGRQSKKHITVSHAAQIIHDVPFVLVGLQNIKDR